MATQVSLSLRARCREKKAYGTPSTTTARASLPSGMKPRSRALPPAGTSIHATLVGKMPGKPSRLVAGELFVTATLSGLPAWDQA